MKRFSLLAITLIAVLFIACAPIPQMSGGLIYAPYAMPQEQFDRMMAGSGAKYFPYLGSAPHYELVGIAVVWGSVNNRIRVSVYDAVGRPAFNVWVRHNYGSDHERFRFTGDPVQFNLGGGSQYTKPADPPNRVLIEGLPSDEVHVGNCNCIGFAHTDWSMSFQLVNPSASTPTPIVSPTLTPAPGVTLTPGFDACDLACTRQEINDALERAKFK